MRSRLVTWQGRLDAEVPATLELDFTQVRFMLSIARLSSAEA
jgi:hypothetical protein